MIRLVKSNMLHNIIEVNYCGDYFIELKFDDGKNGIVDFACYLERGSVFESFKDIEFFRNFSINQELGVLTWGDEIEIAPETLYTKATGTELPDWMESEAVQIDSPTALGQL